MPTMTRSDLENKVLYRSLEGSVSDIDQEKRTVTLSFSSEAEIKRWFGIEILDHSNEKSVKLERLNRSGPLLVDHTIRDHIGKVERAWIDREAKKCRALIRFSRSARAQEIFDDVVDGIRESVSVGYAIHNVELAEKREETAVYRVTDWEPLEISFTAVPADIDVGVGRSFAFEEMSQERRAEMPANQSHNGVDNTSGECSLERKRVTEILAAGERFDCRADAQNAVRDGIPVDEFRARILEKMAAKPIEERGSVAKELGMTSNEVRNFSICRALNAVLSGDWSKAGYERDVSSAIAEKRGQSLDGGFYIPTEMLQRSAAVTTQTVGGLIPTEYRPSEFIELLSARSIVRRLGATFLTGLSGNLSIPRQTAEGEAYWLEEEGEPEQSKLKIDQIQMSPKTLGAYYDLSRRTVQQTSPDVEQFVRKELARLLAVKLDKTIFFGTSLAKGFPGILNHKGLSVAKSNTTGADKLGALNFATICELEYLVSDANADLGAMAFVGNSGCRFQLRQTKEQESATQGIWQAIGGGNGMPTDVGSVLGYPAYVTNLLTNTTYGNQQNMMPLIFGVWNQIMVGEWGIMSVTADPYSLSKSGGLRLVVHYDLDLIIRHIESFAAAYAPGNGPVARPPVERKRSE